MPKLICTEVNEIFRNVLVPKFTRAEVRLPEKSGQKDIGQHFFLKIRTEPGQLTERRQTESGQTNTGHDFPENPDKTRQGQDTDGAVRRRLKQI